MGNCYGNFSGKLKTNFTPTYQIVKSLTCGLVPWSCYYYWNGLNYREVVYSVVGEKAWYPLFAKYKGRAWWCLWKISPTVASCLFIGMQELELIFHK
jgi:hypothetical protein